jgi:hypothetical protein
VNGVLDGLFRGSGVVLSVLVYSHSHLNHKPSHVHRTPLPLKFPPLAPFRGEGSGKEKFYSMLIEPLPPVNFFILFSRGFKKALSVYLRVPDPLLSWHDVKDTGKERENEKSGD